MEKTLLNNQKRKSCLRTGEKKKPCIKKMKKKTATRNNDSDLDSVYEHLQLIFN